jgi:hypothetical protein
VWIESKAFVRSLSIATILFAVIVGLGGCSSRYRVKLPPRAELLPLERVHWKIRRFAQPPEGRRMAACGGLVFVGRTWPAPGTEPTELDEIVIADGGSFYFDNRTGRKVAECSYWYCVKHNAECDAACPPAEWTCDGVDPGRPETEEEARLRAIGVTEIPSAREIRAIEKQLAMPAGSDPMSSYFRYYWAEPESGNRQIRGKFIARHLMPTITMTEANPGLSVENPAYIPSGPGVGCHLIQLKYDPRTKAVVEIHCAGS